MKTNFLKIKKTKNHLFIKKVVTTFFLFTVVCLIARSTEANPNPSKPETISQQQVTITGKVVDENSEPIPGVNIFEKGSKSNGTLTAPDGSFSLTTASNSTVSFSFVGYKTQEITASEIKGMVITLVEDSQYLDEVIVIGYASEKKANLTGSVASVSAAELTKRPVPNPQTLLQGKVSGLDVTLNSGRPGSDGAVMRIRGTGTFSSAGSDPLVLINGIQGNLNNLNPDDIASISVLKDAASAAIYGARAANGVILVTTKSGQAQTKFSINYHGNLQIQEATVLPKMVTNSADYMIYFNEANKKAGYAQWFTDAEIQAYRSNEGKNDPRYPNYDWVDNMYHSALANNHYLSAEGGNDKVSFFVSLGYMNQDGLVKDVNNYKKYSASLAGQAKLTKAIKIGANFDYSQRDTKQLPCDAGSPQDVYDETSLAILSAPPLFTPYMWDGSGRLTGKYSGRIGEWVVRNPEFHMLEGTAFDSKKTFNGQLFVDIDLLDGLVWSTKGNVTFDAWFDKWNERNDQSLYFFDTGAYYGNGYPGTIGVQNSMTTGFLTTFYSTIHYTKSFNNTHNFSILGGYNQEYYVNHYLYGRRKYYPDQTLHEIRAGSPNEQSTDGTSYEWSIQSIFARLTYNFEERYLLEANFRYDGTSRMKEGYQWGGFPSISAAWRISKEDFFTPIAPIFDNLKIRASYGLLGNQNIGNYPYQSKLVINAYPFNSVYSGAVIEDMTNPYITWEKTKVFDVGLDLSVKNGLFTLTADYYNKMTYDILYRVPIPGSVGLHNGPYENNGKLQNRGMEFVVGHNYSIGEFKYGINFNISFNKNKLLKIIEPTIGGTNIIQEGLPWNEYYLYEMEGIFQSDADIAGHATQPYDPHPGDIKYKDQLTIDSDGDGKPDKADGKITDDDKVPMKGLYPDFIYGGSVNLGWKNFELTAFFQGVQGKKNILWGWGVDPFNQGSAPTVDFVEKMWTPERPSNTTPAMYRSDYAPVSGLSSDYYLADCSYLRLKNLMISYSIPQSICKRIGLTGLKIYVSGDNLLTFTPLKNVDPERIYNNVGFAAPPQLKIYTFGLKLQL